MSGSTAASERKEPLWQGREERVMIRTPEQYVESLRDGRVVYQDGERVESKRLRNGFFCKLFS